MELSLLGRKIEMKTPATYNCLGCQQHFETTVELDVTTDTIELEPYCCPWCGSIDLELTASGGN